MAKIEHRKVQTAARVPGDRRAAPAPQIFKLWPDRAPGAMGTAPGDMATLVYYRARRKHKDTAAILVLPGGSYRYLAEHEGAGYARWLAGRGYHAFVLNYRLGSRGYRYPVMLTDAVRAVRFIRNCAARRQIATTRVGVIGSSAGGHLAALLATLRRDESRGIGDATDRENPHPDFAILCYPVITMGAMAHAESCVQFLGARPGLARRRRVSAELRITARTAPCFIWHTVADEAVPVEHSLLFARALRRRKIPFELHLYQDGGHGLGLGRGHPWIRACLRWLGRHGADRRRPPPP